MSNYLEIIRKAEYSEVRKIFEVNKPGFGAFKGAKTAQEIALQQYDVMQHDVMDETKRLDKVIYKPVINDATGEPEQDETTGKTKTIRSTAKVNRVPIPFQEIIVNRRVAFLLSNPIRYDLVYNDDNKKEKSLIDYVYQIEESTKTVYKNKELARRMMSEMEVAELWYLTEIKEPGIWNYIAQKIGISKPSFQLKLKILSPALKDTLYPLFDEYDDMIAFARSYKLKENGTDIEHFDVYTAELTYKYVNRSGWGLDTSAPNGGKIPNLSKKIPIVYYSQAKPEWANVQGMIDRMEKLLSNHSDMNDYFGEPILAIFGTLIQAINKGDSGKILQLAENAKASFLALDSPPESIKMEVENLEKFIYAMSQTPNIAFSEMKSLGDLSGVALELMFMDAHLAAIAKEETFGIGIQRRVNLIKSFIGNVLQVGLTEAANSVVMKPIFTPYMPKNVKELIEALTSSTGSEILSKETATEKLEDMGYIADASQEKERLEDERKANSMVGANSFGF